MCKLIIMQREAIPVLKKKNGAKNVIIRYSMMSGIKLTILLPAIDKLLRQVIQDVKLESKDNKTHYCLILCHSSARCQEMQKFIEQLLTFCSEIVEVIGLYSGDNAENMITYKNSISMPSGDLSIQQLYKSKCKIIVSTPNQFLHLLNKQALNNSQCNSLIVDKIDMHIALELGSELEQIAKAN